MTNLTTSQIEQIKSLKIYSNTDFHKNRKKIGDLPVSMVKEIVAKKRERSIRKYSINSNPLTYTEKTMRLLKWSLECKGTGYFKILVEGNKNIYYASPAYGHSDYNKSIAFPKNEKTLKIMQIFNSIVTK